LPDPGPPNKKLGWEVDIISVLFLMLLGGAMFAYFTPRRLLLGLSFSYC